MDKNMIHIDDLVRQRLGGGQEPDRPGAWLTMRELLDKEMPEVVAAGYNWRRIFGYFTGLLLLTTATVGGYKIFNRYDSQPASGGSGIVYNTNSNSSSTNNNPSNITAVASENTDKPAIPASTVPAANATITSTSTNPVAHSGNHRQASHGTEITQSTASRSTASSAHPVQLRTASNSSTDATPKHGNTRLSSRPSSVNTATSSLTTTVNTTANTPDNTFASSANTTVRTRRTTNPDPGVVNAPQSHALQAAVNSNMGIPKLVTGPAMKRLAHDTIERVELVARRVYDATSQKTILRIDTFPIGRVIVPRVLPSADDNAALALAQDKGQAKSTKNRSANPVSNGKTTTSVDPASPKTLNASSPAAAENSDLVKVSTKHFSLWNGEKFDEAVNKLKVNLARIQIYPGMMAGINGSFFTPNSLGGFQVGLSSLVAINEWWSFLTELKFLYQFNTGSTVRDNYMNVTNSSVSPSEINGVPYDNYSWTEEHVDHYFNYEVIKSYQVPLALRYSWGQFYAQGGLNLVYSTKIDAKEVTYFRDDKTVRNDYRPVKTVKDPFVLNDHPLVRLDDFGSKLGVGYMMGAGYSFTPNVYLDFRLTQSFWNNAKTDGARQISRDLLRTPSIQLSVGYRLAQKH